MNDPASIPDGASPTAAPRPRRALHRLNLSALGVVLSFIALLNIAALSPLVRDSLGPSFEDHRAAAIAAVVLILAFALLLPFIVLLTCDRRGWLRWPQLTALWAAVLLSFAYLTWDDPMAQRPLTMDELAPALSGDEATFRIFLRYAKNTPATNAVKALKLPVGPATGDIARAPDKWIQFLREHRSEIETEWAALAPVRAWWDELAAHPRIGDLTAPDPAAPIIAFQPVRQYAQLAVATASLQALDGRGDEAIATIVRLYDVSRKFEPNSRTLVRAMVAKVIQKMAIQTAGFILDHASVSPASRASLAAELTSAAGGPAGARRLILIEYAFFQSSFTLFAHGQPVEDNAQERLLQKGVRYLGHFFVNPVATQNLVGERYYALAALAEQRRLGEIETSKGPINRDFLDGYHVKNLGGRLFADMAMPALTKVVAAYWDIEDLRAALIARLK